MCVLLFFAQRKYITYMYFVQVTATIALLRSELNLTKPFIKLQYIVYK